MNLIICDDDDGVTTIVERYIRMHPSSGYARIVVCHTMKEVQDIIASGQHIYAIFLDLVLHKDTPPLMGDDTIALIPELKKKCDHIIAISGYEKFKEPALAAGAESFLWKLGDMDTPKNFFEKLAQFFREIRPPTQAESSLQKLREIIHKPTEHGS